MKLKSLILLQLLLTHNILAPLIINTNAQISVAGNMQLTHQNTGLINNGSFAAGNSNTIFIGNASSSIGGSQSVRDGGLGVVFWG